MNYYPYMNMMSMPNIISTPVKTGFFSSLFKNINFGSILNGTSKVLNVANQAIPLIKQAKPVINNAKTMFHVMNEFKKIDNTNSTINRTTVNNSNTTNNQQNVNNVNIEKNANITNVNNNSLPIFFQ